MPARPTLTNEQVGKLKGMRAAGMGVSDLAARFQLSKGHVSSICSGRFRWLVTPVKPTPAELEECKRSRRNADANRTRNLSKKRRS